MIIITLSLILLVIGSFVIGFVESVLIITFIDIILFLVLKPKERKRKKP